MLVGVQVTLVGLFLLELFEGDPLLTGVSVLLVGSGVFVTAVS